MTVHTLKSLRKRLGWSQAQLADYLGLRHKSQVHYLESGRTKICGPKLVLLKGLMESCKNS